MSFGRSHFRRFGGLFTIMFHLTGWQLFFILFTSWCSCLITYLFLLQGITSSWKPKTDDCLGQALLRQNALEERLLRRGGNVLQSEFMYIQDANRKGRVGYRKDDLWIEGTGTMSSSGDEKSKGTTSQLEGTTRRTIAESLDPRIYESHVLYKYNYEYDYQSPKGGVDGSGSGSSADSEDISWKPSSYPNPISEPERCGVASLPYHEQMFNDASKKRLLLCDPDHVLNIQQLDRIAKSIWGFPPMAIPNTSSAFLSGCSTFSTTTAPTTIDSEQTQMAKPSNNDTSDTIAAETSTRTGSANSSSADSEVDKLGTALLTKNFVEIPVAVAILSKLDLRSIFLDSSWHSYQDQADLFNDATQYFSRYLFDQWMTSTANNYSCSRQLGILIFVSVKDFACYVVGGSVVASILPWWRMEYVANEITTSLKHEQNLGDAIVQAIDDLRIFIEMGPPTMTDKIGNFLKRFGVVVGFSLFAFTCAFGSEYGDRLRRWHVIEKRSKLSPRDKIRAMSLQEEYHCTGCPICLEEFPTNNSKSHKLEENAVEGTTQDYGELVPLLGSDGLPLKLLHCGHAFDYTCWKCWVDKGHGDPFKCPVCRQDIGKKFSNSTKREYRPNSTTSLNSRLSSHPDYESVAISWYQNGRLHRQGSRSTPHLLNVRGTIVQPVNGDISQDAFAERTPD